MRKWELKKLIKSFFFSKQSSVPEASSFDNRFKNYGWNTIFFLMEIGRNFQRRFLSLNKDFFQNVPMYTLIVNRTPLLKKFCAKFRMSWKKIRKILLKDWFIFSQFFHLVYCKHAVECKRKEILLEHLCKCEKLHLKIIDVDGIDLKRFFKTFFFHVVKFCEKEVFHFRRLKDLKNCLFAKKYPPLFLKIIFNRTWWLKKTVVAGYFFCFCIHVWMRSKSHQHRSCIFCKKIVNCAYISNRCSLFPLREKTENTRIISTDCGTHFDSFTEIFRRESKPPSTQTQRIFWEVTKLLSFSKRSSLTQQRCWNVENMKGAFGESYAKKVW